MRDITEVLLMSKPVLDLIKLTRGQGHRYANVCNYNLKLTETASKISYFQI